MPVTISANNLARCLCQTCEVQPFGVCSVRFEQVEVFKAWSASWDAQAERWVASEPLPGGVIRSGVPFDIGVVVKAVSAVSGIRSTTDEFAVGAQSPALRIDAGTSGLIDDDEQHVCILPGLYEIAYKRAAGGLDAYSIGDYAGHGAAEDRLFKGETLWFGEDALAPLGGMLQFWMFDTTGLANAAQPSAGRRIELSSGTCRIDPSDENHVLIEGVTVTGGVPGRTKLPVALRMRYFCAISTDIEDCRGERVIEHHVLRSCNHCDPPLAEHYHASFGGGLRGCLESFAGGSFKCEWVAGCSWAWVEEDPSGEYEGSVWRGAYLEWMPSSQCEGHWQLTADYWVDEDPWIHWTYLSLKGPDVLSGGEGVKCEPRGSYVFNWEEFDDGCAHADCSGDCDESCPPWPGGTASGSVS